MTTVGWSVCGDEQPRDARWCGQFADGSEGGAGQAKLIPGNRMRPGNEDSRWKLKAEHGTKLPGLVLFLNAPDAGEHDGKGGTHWCQTHTQVSRAAWTCGAMAREAWGGRIGFLGGEN